MFIGSSELAGWLRRLPFFPVSTHDNACATNQLSRAFERSFAEAKTCRRRALRTALPPASWCRGDLCLASVRRLQLRPSQVRCRPAALRRIEFVWKLRSLCAPVVAEIGVVNGAAGEGLRHLRCREPIGRERDAPGDLGAVLPICVSSSLWFWVLAQDRIVCTRRPPPRLAG